MALLRSLKKRVVVLEVWCSLAWARFLIRFVRFSRWRGLLGSLEGEPAPGELPPLAPAVQKQACDIGRLVNRVADRPLLFRAVCLPRAMAARWVLARRGISSRIVIGSRRDDEGMGHLFHAWLIAGDDVVTGAGERAEYLALQKAGFKGRAADNGS